MGETPYPRSPTFTVPLWRVMVWHGRHKNLFWEIWSSVKNLLWSLGTVPLAGITRHSPLEKS